MKKELELLKIGTASKSFGAAKLGAKLFSMSHLARKEAARFTKK